jgi:hypothetical protein
MYNLGCKLGKRNNEVAFVLEQRCDEERSVIEQTLIEDTAPEEMGFRNRRATFCLHFAPNMPSAVNLL